MRKAGGWFCITKAGITTTLDEIKAVCEIKEDTLCWIKKGIASGSYGHVWVNGKSYSAHRFTWELINGPMPKHLYACHHCNEKSCVNPTHIFAGSPKQNVQHAIFDGLRLKSHEPWGPAGENKKKTHCKRGHPFEGENLGWVGGSRVCLTCRRKGDRERQATYRKLYGSKARE